MYEEKEFLTWFPDYSKAWRKVLEETDQDLGLALEGGKDGGYRSKIFLSFSVFLTLENLDWLKSKSP